jgi:hypothetical protein
MAINYGTCCPEILAELGAIQSEVEEIHLWAVASEAEFNLKLWPYLDLINKYPGYWVESSPGVFMPCLSELVQRVT